MQMWMRRRSLDDDGRQKLRSDGSPSTTASPTGTKRSYERAFFRRATVETPKFPFVTVWHAAKRNHCSACAKIIIHRRSVCGRENKLQPPPTPGAVDEEIKRWHNNIHNIAFTVLPLALESLYRTAYLLIEIYSSPDNVIDTAPPLTTAVLPQLLQCSSQDY